MQRHAWMMRDLQQYTRTREGAERSPSQAHSPTPKLEPVFWLEQYCCTRPSTWAVMARARTATRKQKPRKGSMLCIFFISPGGICGSARATAAAGEEPRNNTAPSPAYCARSEGMQRAVVMGVVSNRQAEGRISVSSRCSRRRAGATEICSGERRRSGGWRQGWVAMVLYCRSTA